jgi:hypothetical protein
MPAAPWYFATRDRIGPLYAKANTPCILSLEAGARGVIISQLCPECVDEGKLPLWRSGISWLELAAITWSADIARIWAGRSDSTSILTRTSLLSPPGSDHGPISGVTVNFGDFEVGPGANCWTRQLGAGRRRKNYRSAPRDEISTFWTAIRTVQDSYVIIEMSENNNEVINFAVVVFETLPEIVKRKDRREDIDSTRRRLRRAGGS